MKKIIPLLLILLLCGCAAGKDTASPAAPTGPEWSSLRPDGSLELVYAEEFAADFYPGGLTLITIGGTDRYLLAAEDAQIPSGLDADITVLRQPLDNLYMASTSAMDLYRAIGGMDAIRLSSQQESSWYIPEAREAMARGDILYAGKYSAPDYELIYNEKCSLAVENTMIYHAPEAKEQLERLGIPVLVERSSYEKHPLGRMEWMKLHGLLLGKLDTAQARFQQELDALSGILGQENTGKTVAFFAINSTGSVTVRKTGDYIPRMIDMAGGKYIFTELGTEETSSATLNMQMEAFYSGARDADVLIYNGAIGQVRSLQELLSLSPLLADFKAVKTGNVWCTGQNVFQETMGLGSLMRDMHQVFTAPSPEEAGELVYLSRLE